MEKIKKFITNSRYLILIGIIIYIVIVFSSLIIKYNNFEYNGLDLAIFNQVFFNSSQGNLFQFTIHPHSYLGDHFTPFLLLILPLYALFQSPLTLLLLQTIIIALCTIPIYLLAKHNLNKTWALILPILWLINPLVINMNFFEFHLLPFATFFLLFTIYFYQKKNWPLFIIFSLLALTVREDVFLVIIMFGILALIEKRKIKWILSPILLSITWFVLAQAIITTHNPTNTYKFISYYNWLGGNSFLEIVLNYLTHPLEIVRHLLIFPNIVMFISLLIPFIFLPLLKPKYLLLSSLVYLQYALTESGGGDLIIRTHYLALFIPGIIASLILAIKFIHISDKNKSTIIKIIKDNHLVLIIIILSHIYLLFTLSPLNLRIWEEKNEFRNLEREIKQELLEQIPKDKATASSYDFLPQLSSRPKLYSLNYAWSGYKELSDSPYQVPSDLEYVYINFEDLIKYELQYIQNDPQERYKNSYLNWQKLFTEYNLSPLKIIDTYGVWQYDLNSKNNNALYEIIDNLDLEINNEENILINDEIKFLGWNLNEINEINKLDKTKVQLLPMSLYFEKVDQKTILDNYQLQLSMGDHSKIYPLTYGFYPSSKWQNDEVIKINYWFIIPPGYLKKELTINLIKLQGSLSLDKNLSIIKNYKKKDILKPDINIVW
jgi:uncharacterized membrane protein